MEEKWNSRTELLIGKEGIEKLQNAKVAIYGVGGVGSFVAEGLARSGIGNMVLIDNDVVSISNLNRQIHANIETIGKKKVEVMKERNEKKAKLVYDYLDQSTFYKAHSDKENRSLMNVTFTTTNKDLDAKFVKESIEAGMTNLKGHRSVGGIRASIYNAMPYEGVEKLVAFMKEFEENNR